ncbi:hypothetical protein [Mesorhizobium sp.]|uniref:AAA family ATPase n=1 Tax=Mesorhizobium sp. TaxID=1871066 RepID=UPI0025D63E71|nr:hypothetical protein [Mesorhizobium sp.]
MNAINTKVLPTKRKQVALFSSDPQFKREVATRLDALAIYDVRISETADFLNGPPPETRPGIVILDLGHGELLGQPGIVAARALWTTVPLIAVSDELTSEQTRILVRMNASDWLHKPLDAKELLNAVTFHDTGNQGTKSRIITFISASGGAGATTLALSAAEFLASKSTERAASTCLVDLDFQSANCGAYLNLFNQFDLAGIIGQPERLDVELMDVIKLSRPSIHSRGRNCRLSRRAPISCSGCWTSSPTGSTTSSSTCRISKPPGRIPCFRRATRSSSSSSSTSPRCGKASGSTRRSANCAAIR